jgi:hypothetical protein
MDRPPNFFSRNAHLELIRELAKIWAVTDNFIASLSDKIKPFVP